MNLPGHNLGHKAPFLGELNRQRNPLARIGTRNPNVRSKDVRKIAEAAIGRKLTRDEVVHHINGDNTDNRLENLQVMTKTDHKRLHMRLAVTRYKGGGAHE